MSTNDYLIEVKVKNNWLYKKLFSSGYDSVADFCRKHKLSMLRVGKYINLKDSPQNLKGEWKISFLQIAFALKCPPEELCPPQHRKLALKKNKSEFEANLEEVAGYLSGNEDTSVQAIEGVIKQEDSMRLNELLKSLTPREERVIRMHFGFDGEEKTYQEIGEDFNLTREAIRQIEARAFRKLKHGKNSREVKDVSSTFGVIPRFNTKPKNRKYVPEWITTEEKTKEQEEWLQSLKDGYIIPRDF